MNVETTLRARWVSFGDDASLHVYYDTELYMMTWKTFKFKAKGCNEIFGPRKFGKYIVEKSFTYLLI